MHELQASVSSSCRRLYCAARCWIRRSGANVLVYVVKHQMERLPGSDALSRARLSRWASGVQQAPGRRTGSTKGSSH